MPCLPPASLRSIPYSNIVQWSIVGGADADTLRLTKLIRAVRAIRLFKLLRLLKLMHVMKKWGDNHSCVRTVTLCAGMPVPQPLCASAPREHRLVLTWAMLVTGVCDAAGTSPT